MLPRDYVGIGDLLVRGGVGARVDKVLARALDSRIAR